MRRKPLPPQLKSGPFLVRDSGLSESRLRASDLNRRVWGVRIEGDGNDLRTRCLLFAERLTDQAFFSHSTSALLLGVPLPLSLERSAHVHVSVAAPASAPHARGMIGHSLTVAPADIIRRRGLRQTSAARTWCDLAALLDLDDLVAAGDYLIHRDSPLTSRAEMGLVLDRMGRMRGTRRARAALPLLDDRPASPQESKLRLIVLRSGLPEPEINYTLVDSETGKHVRPDLLFRSHKLILEYQGEYHRTRAQWRRDMTRRSRLEAEGWHVMELNSDDLRDPEELVARIRQVLARRS